LRLLNLKKRYNSNDYNKNKLNIAASAQNYLSQIVLNLVADSYKKTKIRNICFAGGVFLNCQTIMKVSKLEFIENIFVQPASSDAGAALGAAILASNKNKKYQCTENLYLGNNFTNSQILKVLKNANAKYTKINKKSLSQLMIEISRNKIFAIFKGRHEFGPRALGNRSIMASPKNKNMKNILNMKIKFREAFRPFAPIIRDIDSKYFFDIDLPYKAYNSMNINVSAKAITKKKYPSVVHVDGTSRVQVIRKTDNKFLYELLTQLKEKNNIDCLINTSFNLDKMPIVNTPVDALSVFFAAGIDYLILGDFIVFKKKF
jgi:carbamoyltransferase